MKEIQLTQGKVALVDDDMFEYLNQWKWAAQKDHETWYAVRCDYTGGKKTFIRMHRLIMDAKPHELVDHQFGNGLDNQRHLLRKCTHSQNMSNRKASKTSGSKLLGVTWHSRQNKWMAQIRTNGKRIFLGYHTDKAKAAITYNNAAIKYHGEFARLNILNQ